VKPRQVDAYDTTAGTVGTVPLADVAADIRRYELLTEAEPEAEP
jgi:hypothetical protein